MKSTKKLIALSLCACIGAGFFSSCGKESSTENKTNIKTTTSKDNTKEETTNEETKKDLSTEYTVNSEWLKANMSDDKLVILDARNNKLYVKNHIPGAVNIAWQGLSLMEGKTSDENWGTVLNKDDLQTKLRALGINDDSTVIIYTDTTGGWGDDGRILWTLKKAGIKNAKLLDGGITTWMAANYDLTPDVPEITEGNITISSLDNSMTISTEELSKNLDSYKIIDTRNKSEFDGAQKYGELRGGHIPGAVNIEFNSFIDENGNLKSADEIAEILTQNNISKTDTIVTYCTAGIRSAHMAMVLKNIGYDNVLNYDESIYAWAADDSLELVK